MTFSEIKMKNYFKIVHVFKFKDKLKKQKQNKPTKKPNNMTNCVHSVYAA